MVVPDGDMVNGRLVSGQADYRLLFMVAGVVVVVVVVVVMAIVVVVIGS